MPVGLAPFTDALIEVVKEEGDTSQVNQVFDQSVAKEDKKLIGTALDRLPDLHPNRTCANRQIN